MRDGEGGGFPRDGLPLPTPKAEAWWWMHQGIAASVPGQLAVIE